MITIEQLKDVKERTEALYRYLTLKERKYRWKKNSFVRRHPVLG